MRNEAYRGYPDKPHIPKGMQRVIGRVALMFMLALTSGCVTNEVTPQPRDTRFDPILLVSALANGSCFTADGTISPEDVFQEHPDSDLAIMGKPVDGYAEPRDLCMFEGPSCGGKAVSVAFPDGMVICFKPIAP